MLVHGKFKSLSPSIYRNDLFFFLIIYICLIQPQEVLCPEFIWFGALVV